jgi:glycosyltransferase involved in cell wall biosynthesis
MVRGLIGRGLAELKTRLNPRLRVSLWNEFHKPPYGGGNQFMLALRKALLELGVRVYVNDTDPKVDVHLCNSAWFDVEKLRRLQARHKIRLIQRIDGIVSIARGHADSSVDDKIYALNSELALATVYQSRWCHHQAVSAGYRPISPCVIMNAVDDGIFNRSGRVPFNDGRKVRLITMSWSDNPRKGGAFYRQLEKFLDWDRFEYTFVGRTKEVFERIKHIQPLASKPLANVLRRHDIFITATEKDACSNALIEALACGLPSLALLDGGNPELVREGGMCFSSMTEFLSCLNTVTAEYEKFQSAISVPSIQTVASRYINIMDRIMSIDPK